MFGLGSRKRNSILQSVKGDGVQEFAHLILVVALLCGSAFFSSSETALFSLSRIEKARLEKTNPKWFRWVMFHLKHPRQVLGAILIGNLFVNTLAASIVTLLAIQWLGHAWVGLVLAIFTCVLILLGEILPKVLAVRNNESIALLNSIPLAIFSVCVSPILKIIRWVSDGIVSKISRDKSGAAEGFSEEELQALVKIGEEEGILDREERRMIQKIFDFGERQVKEIMTPRVKVQGFDVEEPVATHLDLIREHHFTRFLVYQASLDNVLGFVGAQDYVLSDHQDLNLLMKQPLFIPETKRVDDLLAEFRTKKQDFAVCVDEFGGTAGIVTLEDILEEVFGEFYDEYSEVENPIRPFGFQEYLVEAKIPLKQINEELHLNLKSESASTLGGLILEKLGEVPEKGRRLELEGCEVRVLEVLRRRSIQTVVMKVLQ